MKAFVYTFLLGVMGRKAYRVLTQTDTDEPEHLNNILVKNISL